MKDVRSDGVDHKFKGDIFITLLLVEIFEICKETYRGYREREV